METSMRVSVSLILTMASLSVIILIAVVGTKEAKDYGKIIQDYKPEVQKINELITAALASDAVVTCIREGGLYRYEINIKDLGVVFKDDRNPDKEITVMPVLGYKGKKSLDSEKESLELKSGVPQTFGMKPNKGLNYVIISPEPPTIFRNDETWYDGYIVKDQVLYLNNYKITAIEQLRLSKDKTLAEIAAGIPSSDSVCTLVLEASCFANFPERKQLGLNRCDEGKCEKSVIVCDTPLDLKIDEFDPKDARCEQRTAKVYISTDPEKKLREADATEKLTIGFCGRVKDAYDCSFVPDKTDYYGPMTVTVKPENYFVGDCIRDSQDGTQYEAV